MVARFPDEESARQFLALVRYESMRAGRWDRSTLLGTDVYDAAGQRRKGLRRSRRGQREQAEQHSHAAGQAGDTS